MASIAKRGKSYQAQVSSYRYGEHKKLTKIFATEKEAQLWSLEMELVKGEGKEPVHRVTTFADFFENWIYPAKVSDVKETTSQNYVRTLGIIQKLFQDIQLKDLNDIVVQKKIDGYAKTHSRRITHEILFKIRTSLHDAYARGYIANDFARPVKTRGENPSKRNKALSITDFRKLRNYVLQHPEDGFNVLVLLALETGMWCGEPLAIRPESSYEYGIEVRHSISPTSDNTSLEIQNVERDVSINKEVYELVRRILAKENGYILSFGGFKQSEQLIDLLEKLDISKITFHGLRDAHASFLFAQDIDIAYVSKRLGHVNIQTTQNYYLELISEKKHQQDANALSPLSSLWGLSWLEPTWTKEDLQILIY